MKQTDALNVMKMGHNVFLTGAAGAGKTYVLNDFIKYLKSNSIGVAVTASTGIAATHLNGMTIHSWAGIGINDEITPEHLQKILDKKQLQSRFKKTKVLIIDEVSMLHGIRLDLVDQVARAFKDKDKPFGGIQVILSGDLFQLPPITKEGEPDFIFLSKAWKQMNLKICYLSEQHRQEDNDLLGILNGIRAQSLEDDYHGNLLRDRMQEKTSGGDRTRLYTHNADVDQINRTRLKELDTESKAYYMKSKGSKRLVESLINNCLAPEVLELKVGTEVMFVANNPREGYMNGTRGKVTTFTDEGLPVIFTKNDTTIVPNEFSWKVMDGESIRAEINQLPLRHAWAITIHKSQGMTLDEAEIDLSRAFEPGMGYVALSRVRTLDGLFLLGANNNAFLVSPVIAKLNESLLKQSKKLEDALKTLGTDAIKANQHKVVSVLSTKKVEDEKFEYDEELFEEFKKWRAGLAKKDSVPAYIILNDKTLKLICSVKPSTEQQLSEIHGMGTQKLEKYSKDILKTIGSKKK